MRSRITGLLVWMLASFSVAPALALDRTSLHFVTEPFPPYTYESKGRAAGPMVDVLEAVCAQLKRSCKIEVLPWRRALRLAQKGEVDGIFTVLDTPERRSFFHISLPVIDARYGLFAQAGADFRFEGDRQQMKGRTVGVYGPSGSSYALDQLIEGVAEVQKVLEYDNITVLRKLAAGRYGPLGLVLINEAVGLHLIRSEKLSGLQAAGTVKQFSYAFGLNRARVSTDDAKAFDAALSGLCSSGRTAALLKPYALPAAACKHA
jgi:polar amino acid transport system substrate-binding protein